MKLYSAPQIKDVVLHTENIMFNASGGQGNMSAGQQSTNEKGIGTDIWNDKETEE